jgi:hypothetical protein
MIFVDHASGYIFVEPVVNFTAVEALRAKRKFEQEMRSMGITTVTYHADIGVFTAASFEVLMPLVFAWPGGMWESRGYYLSYFSPS